MSSPKPPAPAARPEIVPPDDESREITPFEGTDSLSALTRGEIDIQIATAKRYPRSVTDFKRVALEMATLDEATAASMFYALPRADKTIEGPSVRLAEIVGSAWGNLRYGARVIEISDRWVTAQGACFDMEKNLACSIETRRRIVDKNGRRFNDDMIGVTSNAACSVALRQAIFKIVPMAYVKDILAEARLVAVGKHLTMEQRRTRIFEWFAKIGASQEDVLSLMDRKGPADLTVDDVIILLGLKTAIQDGETTFDETLSAKVPGEPIQMPRRKSENDSAGKSGDAGSERAREPAAAAVQPGAVPGPAPAPAAPPPAPAPAASPAGNPPREGTSEHPASAAGATETGDPGGGGRVASPTAARAAYSQAFVTKTASVSPGRGRGEPYFQLTLDDGSVWKAKDGAVFKAAAEAEKAGAKVNLVIQDGLVLYVGRT